jgi:hypothetical protein
MKSELEGQSIKIDEATIERQCDREFFDAIKEEAGKHDAILSMACGAGVQFTAEVLEPIKVMPALDTRFIGVTTDEGIWAEKCRACGNCLLSDYGVSVQLLFVLRVWSADPAVVVEMASARPARRRTVPGS